MDFEKACKKDECAPGNMVERTIGKNPVLIANVDGKYYACGGRCTHAGGPLADGELEGKIVTCPWHGAEFDVTTGKHLSGPGSADEPVYKTKVEGDDVKVKT